MQNIIYDKNYHEIYALLAMDYLYKHFSENMIKDESPDWVNIINDIGFEVCIADNNHLGYTNKFSNNYLGKNKKDIPYKELESFTGELYFDDNDRLYAISDSKGLVNGKRGIILAIESLKKKAL